MAGVRAACHEEATVKLAVLITRKSQLPHFEGTIRAAAARGHEVLLILDTRLLGGPKADQAPEYASLPPRFLPWLWRAREVRDGRMEFLSSVDGVLDYDQADALLYTHAPGFIMRAWHGVVARLQCDWSTLMSLTPKEVAGLTRVYGWTPHWVRWWAEWHGVNPTLLQERFVAVGMPLAEHLTWINPKEARKALDVPDGQPFIIYLQFPSDTLRWSWWTHGVYGGRWPGVATERAVARKVRIWCNREDILFVVKARQKNPVRPWLRDLADRVVYDEPGEPGALRLLAAGPVALVHHLSTAAAEAVAAGVWAYCLAPRPPERIPPYAKRLQMEAFSANPDSRSFYRFPGCSSALTPREFIDLLWDVRRPRPLEESDRRAYVERYVGPEPFDAGLRIVEDLEKVIKEA